MVKLNDLVRPVISELIEEVPAIPLSRSQLKALAGRIANECLCHALPPAPVPAATDQPNSASSLGSVCHHPLDEEIPQADDLPCRHVEPGSHNPTGPPFGAVHGLDPLLDQKQAAEFLGLSVHTLEAWRSRGHGPVYIAVSPRAIRYRRSDLINFTNRRARHSTSDAPPEG